MRLGVLRGKVRERIEIGEILIGILLDVFGPNFA